MTEHYFSEGVPATDAERRRLTVRLGGRDVDVETAGGVFSAGALDKATQVLLDEVDPPPAAGQALDLGCGWGPIALELALRSPDLDVTAVDVNERALDLVRRNAAALGCDRVRAVRAQHVDPGLRYDVIWSNPPIRVGKSALHDLLSLWLPRLAPDGRAWLVVGKQLGADSLQRWVGSELDLRCERTATSKGFRVLRVSR